jgi:hypothetical protein
LGVGVAELVLSAKAVMISFAIMPDSQQ